MMNRKMLAAAVAATLAAPGMAMAQEEGAGPIDWDFYGSLRIQYEAADPEGESSYDGFRDAYSRVGFTADMPLNDGLGAFAQLEMPLDLANGRVQDPFAGDRSNDDGEDIRIAKIGLESDVAGTFAYGRDWMPYYNAIAFPVDMFSSFQSGFATYTTFRESDTLFYYSPDFNGFSFGAAYSANSGACDDAFDDDGNCLGSDDDRYQLTGSYTIEDTTFAIGIDDIRGDNNERLYGFSAMHTMGDLSLSAKVEYYDSDIDDGYGEDGDIAANVYAAYDWGQHTFKGMVANVDNYGEDVFHLGYDFHFNDALMFFAEYYYEEEGTGAIPVERARDTGGDPVGFGPVDDDEDPTGSNNVFMVGMHYSF
ncbi:porin [Thioalkalivibrio sp. ALJ24]|uniref:porin n=1 Tax=Thioalkalivibrio sp. ALJ24 TaxID=545276 RepID=UPI00037D47FD|nr:porin [Thioalkalivibrio sp. ALJ24]